MLLLALALAMGAPPAGMNEAGVRAAEERRFCDASSIFVQLHGHTKDPLALYRAAETAFAAGDYLAAIRLYRTLLDNHATFERKGIVETRLAELLLIVREKGPGTACALPPRICGDWVVSAGESCDDGNLNDGDGCDGTCQPTGCGNGSVTGDEVCDDGNVVEGDGCDGNCTLSACGNGAKGPSEGCDDGNVVDGDGCDVNCSVSACGNGVKAANEDCDDGNVENDDGCSSSCAIEVPSKPFPVGVFAGGAAAVVVGGAVAAIGTLPVFAHGDAKAAVRAAEDDAAVDPDVGLARAATAQQAQSRAQQDWTTWGLPLVCAGSALAVAGVAVAASAFVFDFSPPEETAPAAPTTTTAPLTTTTTAVQP